MPDTADYDLDTILSWRGRTVVDRKGQKLGKLEDLYLDTATDQPSYAGVRTGLFGRHQSVVPLAGMQERDGDLVVPHDAELVRDAPALDPDATLSERDEQRLASHYVDVAPTAPDVPQDASPAMTRSEEEVVTSHTNMRPAERVRLRKVLVTDHVKRTVPVRREEVRLDTDPPPEGHIESAEDVD
jgi:sporulation protein YlmC with PRC-barrel domain